MSWQLGLSVGPGGVAAATRTQQLGVFPTMAQAVDAAGRVMDGPPERVVLVHPSGISVTELRRAIGDLAAVGIGDDNVELLSDVAVLSRVLDGRVVLVDTDRDVVTTHPGRSRPCDPDSVAALVEKQSDDTTITLIGHPENRDRYHGTHHIDRASLAATALQVPATNGVSTTPRTAGALRHTPGWLWIWLAFPVIMLIVLFVLL